MRLMSQTEVRSLIDQMINELPRHVLNTVGRLGGCREHQVVNEARQWLPETDTTRHVGEWIADILEWFVQNGDIEKGAGGRYRCIPGYAIGDLEDREVLNIYGDPRCESLLKRAGNTKRIILRSLVVGHGESLGRNSGNKGYDRERKSCPIGVERMLAAQGVSADEVRQVCDEAGVVIVQLSELGRMLTGIRALLPPSRPSEAPVLPRTGLWEVYDPSRPVKEGFWRSHTSWRDSSVSLVRWRPVADWQGNKHERTFYHFGSGLVTEVGSDYAALWRYRICWENGVLRSVCYDGDMLWIPVDAPPKVVQWLRITAGVRPRRQLDQLGFSLEPQTAEAVGKRLEDILGVRFQACP